jgi:transaldolase/glucose-6-phosphate isomerase
MGGSSLAPEVYAATLPVAAGHPGLTVIDSTHPDSVRSVARAADPSTTWYVISSKSGGTLETLSLFRNFWAVVSEFTDTPGSHFVAITDPGSSLRDLAADRGFRSIILADPNVGGRYSALSAFGLVPAGLIGADIPRLLDAGASAAVACGQDVPAEANPGFLVGATLGTATGVMIPTVYFAASRPARYFPIWAEQLIAESTGKEGIGVLPVAGGPPMPTAQATIVSVGSEALPGSDVEIFFEDPYDIAGAMFLLEYATAVAGEIMGIHPFDQPDVQLAKTLAHQAMEGQLTDSGEGPIAINTPEITSAVAKALTDSPSYVALQAYLDATPATDAALEEVREAFAAGTGRYVTAGYGPRFLHSTGQFHKGGGPGGVCVQFLDEPQSRQEVAEADFTFNELIEAQAIGDRAALVNRDRTVIAVNLGDDPVGGLRAFARIVRDETR